MKEIIANIQIKDLSPAEIVDLKKKMPGEFFEDPEKVPNGDRLGALDPVTATVVISQGLGGLIVLGSWLLKNRRKTVVKVESITKDSRKTMEIEMSESLTEAEVVKALTEGINELK